MSDLSKLQSIGEDLVPIIEDVFKRLKQGDDAGDITPRRDVIQRLKRVVAASNRTTQRDVVTAMAAVAASRRALRKVLREAASSNESLPSTKARVIEKQIDVLMNKLAILAEQEVLTDLARLLPESEIQRYGKILERASEAVADRENVQRVIAGIADVAIVAARIAVKII